MNRQLALLHTAASNVDVFEAASADLGLHDLTLSHHLRADLLAGGADGVILTCSTLGPAVAGT